MGIKSYGTCGKYCKSLGLTCVSAYEEVSNTCTIESTFGCDTKVLGSDGKVTSDALCKCTADTGSTAKDTSVDATATAKDAGTATTMGGGAKMGGHYGGGGIATPGSRMDPEAGAEVTSAEESGNEEQEHEQEQEEEDDDEEKEEEEEEGEEEDDEDEEEKD